MSSFCVGVRERGEYFRLTLFTFLNRPPKLNIASSALCDVHKNNIGKRIELNDHDNYRTGRHATCTKHGEHASTMSST